MGVEKINVQLNAKDNASGAFKNLKSSTVGLRDAVKGLVGAFALVKIKDFAAESIGAAADFEQASQAMAAQFGKNAEDMIASLSAVAGGTINNTDLVISANRAMALNVTDDVGQMADLLEFARVRGRAMGLDTTQAFNDIVTGIGRGSPLILDNLGIITKGWAEEAAAAGVAYDSQFILNKVLEQGAGTMANLGTVTNTNKENLQRLKASYDNFKVMIGEALLPILDVLFTTYDNLRAMVDNNSDSIAAFKTFMSEELMPVIEALWFIIKTGIEATRVIWETGWEYIKLVVSNTWAAITAAVKIAWEILSGVIMAGAAALKGDWAGAWEEIKSAFSGVWDAMTEFVSTAIDNMMAFINKLISGVKDAIKFMKNLIGLSGGGSSGATLVSSVSGQIAGAKADGGPVTGGSTYLVGERGPELFTPNTSGQIIPNHKMGGGTQYVFNFNGTFSSREVAEEYADLMIGKLKLASKVV